MACAAQDKTTHGKIIQWTKHKFTQLLNAKRLYKTFSYNVNHLCETLSREITFCLFVCLFYYTDEYHETHLVHFFLSFFLCAADVENVLGRKRFVYDSALKVSL